MRGRFRITNITADLLEGLIVHGTAKMVPKGEGAPKDLKIVDVFSRTILNDDKKEVHIITLLLKSVEWEEVEYPGRIGVDTMPQFGLEFDVQL